MTSQPKYDRVYPIGIALDHCMVQLGRVFGHLLQLAKRVDVIHRCRHIADAIDSAGTNMRRDHATRFQGGSLFQCCDPGIPLGFRGRVAMSELTKFQILARSRIPTSPPAGRRLVSVFGRRCYSAESHKPQHIQS